MSEMPFDRRDFLKTGAGGVLLTGFASQTATAESVAEGPTVYVGSHDNTLYAVDAATGEQEWAFTEPSRSVYSSPTVVDGTVYVGSYDNTLYAVDAATGEQEWAFETDDSTFSSPTVVDGTVYVGSNDDTLYAVDAATGEQEWAFETYGDIRSSPTVIADPANGDSIGSRVLQGTLGHTDAFAEQGPTEPGEPDDPDEPQIDPTSVEIQPYPVEIGEIPTITVRVENADEVDLVVAGTSIPMEQTDENTWSAEVSQSFSPSTWVDLSIQAKNENTDQPVEIDTIEIDDPLDDEHDGWLIEKNDLGYHIFEHVAETAVVIGRFENENIPTESEKEHLKAWKEARTRDANYYFGSTRGVRGAIGFRFKFFDNNSELFEVSGDDGDYDDVFEYMAELKTEAESTLANELSNSVDFEDDFDLWIGTHREDPVGYREGRYEPEENWVYFAIESLIPKPGAEFSGYHSYKHSYNIFLHELGHACGLRHPHEVGNDANKCVMTYSSRTRIRERHRAKEVNPISPLSVMQQFTESLDLHLGVSIGDSPTFDYERQDWLTINETDYDSLNEDWSGPLTVPSLKSRERDDLVPMIVRDSRIPGRDFKYIFISRTFIDSNDGPIVQWGEDEGGLVIYKWEELGEDFVKGVNGFNVVVDAEREDDEKRSLRQEGEILRDRVSAYWPTEIVFELVDKTDVTDPESFATAVRYRLDGGESNTEARALKEFAAIPSEIDITNCTDFTAPSLSLKAIDAQGRIVGTHEGEYMNEIPGARYSGKRTNGTEWISVPEDVDVDFKVSSKAVEQFIEDMEDIGTLSPTDSVSKSELENKMVVEYDISATQYGSNPELIGENGQTVVTDASTRVQRQEIHPGEEQEATPRNDFSKIDIVSIHPITENEDNERVILTNTGEEKFNLNGWRLKNESGDTFVFPEFELDPGSEVTIWTGNGDDTDTNLYWDAETSKWDVDGGRVRVLDETGEIMLNVTYDERGVIAYEEPPEEDDPSGEDYADPDGIIRLDGLRDAIADWRDGVITKSLLEEITDAWRTRREVY